MGSGSQIWPERKMHATPTSFRKMDSRPDEPFTTVLVLNINASNLRLGALKKDIFCISKLSRVINWRLAEIGKKYAGIFIKIHRHHIDSHLHSANIFLSTNENARTLSIDL